MACHGLPYLTKSCHLSWKKWEIRFGSRFMDGTNGQFGVLEMILSTSISGVLFSTFAGQPLSILGATGPFLAYTLVVFDLAEAMDIEFMPFYCGLACGVRCSRVLVAMFDLCALYEACDHVQWRYLCGPDQLNLHHWRRATNHPELHWWWDEVDQLLSGGTFVPVHLCHGHLPLPHAPNTVDDATSSQPPGQFFSHNCLGLCICPGSHLGQWCVFEDAGSWHQPFSDLAVGICEKRPWIVNPNGIEQEFPAWAIAFAMVPAIGFAVLGYLDQKLTSVIVNRPSNGLQKGPGYHLDLFVRGAITLPACAVLGLPLSVASTVPSITHVISLTTYEVKAASQGERKVPVKVVEQRATNFLIHILIGLALFLAPVLKFLPRAVLQGVFFYMALPPWQATIWRTASFCGSFGAQELSAVQVHSEAANEACAPVHLRADDLLGHPVRIEGDQGDIRCVPLLHGFSGHHPKGASVLTSSD